MTYNSVAEIRAKSGITETTVVSDATIGYLQADADAIITAYTSSPNTAAAKVVEARLTIEMMERSLFRLKPTDRIQYENIHTELTAAEKQMLRGTIAQIFAFDGYYEYDME